MSHINEKTLELNVTSELLNIPFWPKDLVRTLHLPLFFPYSRFWGRRRHAIGLSLQDEGEKGGYDVEISIPSTPAKCVFFQFKAGQVVKYTMGKSTIPNHPRNNSIFLGSKTNPKPHFLFKGINKNANMNQHHLMRDWSVEGHDGKTAVPVLYALPLVKDIEDLKTKVSSGRLLTCVEFKTIAEVDASYFMKHGELIDRESHEIAISVNDSFCWEIRSDNPASSNGSKTTPTVLGEILAWEIWKMLYFRSINRRKPSDFQSNSFLAFYDSLLIGAAAYLGVNFSEFNLNTKRLLIKGIYQDRIEEYQARVSRYMDMQQEKIDAWELEHLLWKGNEGNGLKDYSYWVEQNPELKEVFLQSRRKLRLTTLQALDERLQKIFEFLKYNISPVKELPPLDTEFLVSPNEKGVVNLFWNPKNGKRSIKNFEDACKQTCYQVI